MTTKQQQNKILLITNISNYCCVSLHEALAFKRCVALGVAYMK